MQETLYPASTRELMEEARMPNAEHTIVTVLGEPYCRRFWSYVEKTATCWLWTGGHDGNGYGNIRLLGRFGAKFATHRLSYEMECGAKIATGQTLDHLCRNIKCVRPDHLEPVSHKENILRGVGRGAQHARQEHCPICGSEYEYLQWKPEYRFCRLCKRRANRESEYRDREAFRAHRREYMRERRANKNNNITK